MEKRRFERINTDRAVQLHLSDGSVVRARMINISLGGIAIDYPRATENGIELGIAFTLPLNGEVLPIQARVRTCYSHVHGNDYCIGLQFIEIGKQELKNIALFVEYKKNCKVTQPGFVVDYRNRSY